MAEDDAPSGGGGGGVGAMLTRKVGPLPIWSWVMAAGAIGFIIYRMKSGSSSSSGSGTSGTSGQGSQFNSSTSQTTTNPSTGDTTTNSYSASGDGYLPGQLTYGAGSMPVSSGDIYINEGAGTSTTTSGTSPTQETGYNYTVLPGAKSNTGGYSGQFIQTITQTAYGIPNASDPISAAYMAMVVRENNPQVDWQTVDTNGGLIPAGTQLVIPGITGPQQGTSWWHNFTVNPGYTGDPAVNGGQVSS